MAIEGKCREEFGVDGTFGVEILSDANGRTDVSCVFEGMEVHPLDTLLVDKVGCIETSDVGVSGDGEID